MKLKPTKPISITIGDTKYVLRPHNRIVLPDGQAKRLLVNNPTLKRVKR